MLTLLTGIDWVANRDELLTRIAHDVKNKKGNRILLVPELISHDTERRLSSVAGDTCSRFAEVLTFSRLVQRVCQWCCCGAEDCLDAGGRLVAMAAAVRQIHSKLKAYASVETKPEFLHSLVDAVDEFKRCCISSADLLRASKETDGAFAQKLEELSLILEAYDAVCNRTKIDPRDQMNWLLDLLDTSDFAAKHTVYIDGFPDFTRQHFAVIEHFIANSENVIISINTDSIDSSNPAFEKASDTMAQFVRLAKKLGIPVNFESVSPRQSKLLSAALCTFQGNTTNISLSPEMLRVCSAETIQIECAQAAEQILELIHCGVRYRQIAVTCTDLSAYANALQTELTRCGIPTYIAGTEDILSKPVISTVLNALDVALGGFQTADVLRYLKSAVSPLSLQICDSIDNYTYLWKIHGAGWLKPWTMHPKGLEAEWNEADYISLQKLNEAREFSINPLIRLRDNFNNAALLSNQVESILSFLSEINYSERLNLLAKKMNEAGDLRNAQVMSQLWEILLKALQQLSAVLGNTKWDSETFSRLLKLLLSQYDVGTIPTVLDTVVVGTVNSMRCQQAEHVLILGANEGAFPTYANTTGILTDTERTELRKMGVPLTGGASDGLQIAFSEIYGTLNSASKSIYISALSDQVSFAWKRLLQMSEGIFSKESVLGSIAANQEEAAAFLLRNKEKSAAEDLEISDIYSSLESKINYAFGQITEEGINRIYGKTLNLSASQIDKQADCRLAYFLRYGLRAEPRKAAEVDPAEFGTYVHAVLEYTGRKVQQLGGFQSVTLDQTLEIALEYSKNYITERFSQIDSERISYLFSRNIQELIMVVTELWDEFQDSSFEPVGFEVAFGDNADLSAIALSGQKMNANLRGFVDRIDTWKNDENTYFRVVDYKTGQKSFDYCDVFNGLGLQMLIYLFALEQGGSEFWETDAIPAGVQYFPARAPVLSSDGMLTDEEAAKERKSVWRRKGLLLNDTEVLTAMEHTNPPERLSYRKRKDGTITGDIADKQQFHLLKKYVFSVLGKMVDDIASGNVEPNPYTRGSSHDACRFCDYNSICHSGLVDGRRNYQAMSSQRFWEEVEKEMSKSD